MATANKAPKAPKAPKAATPAPVAPVAPVAAPVAAPVVATVAGTAVTLTRSQAALVAAKHGGRVMAGQVGVAYIVGSKPYKVRTPTNLAQWQAVLAAMQANGGRATVDQMVAQGFPLTLAAPFVAYATNRGWLAPAPA